MVVVHTFLLFAVELDMFHLDLYIMHVTTVHEIQFIAQVRGPSSQLVLPTTVGKWTILAGWEQPEAVITLIQVRCWCMASLVTHVLSSDKCTRTGFVFCCFWVYFC